MHPNEVRLLMAENPWPPAASVGGHALLAPQGLNTFIWHNGEWTGDKTVAGFLCSAEGPDDASTSNWAIAISMNQDSEWLTLETAKNVLSQVMKQDRKLPFEPIPYE